MVIGVSVHRSCMILVLFHVRVSCGCGVGAGWHHAGWGGCGLAISSAGLRCGLPAPCAGRVRVNSYGHGAGAPQKFQPAQRSRGQNLQRSVLQILQYCSVATVNSAGGSTVQFST